MAHITQEKLEEVMTIANRSVEGVTAREVAEALTSPPDQPTLQKWLAMLIDGQRLEANAAVNPIRYRTLSVRDAIHAAPLELESDEAVGTLTTAPSATPSACRDAFPASAAAESANHPPSESAIAEAFAAAVPMIVGRLMPPLSTVVYLQNVASLRGWKRDATARLVAYGKANLELLTAEDALAYGLELEQYDRWYAHYFGQMAAAAPTFASGE